MTSFQHVSTYFPGFRWLGLLDKGKVLCLVAILFTAMLSNFYTDTSRKHSSRFSSPSVRKHQQVWECYTRLRSNTSEEWQKCWSKAELLVHTLAGFGEGTVQYIIVSEISEDVWSWFVSRLPIELPWCVLRTASRKGPSQQYTQRPRCPCDSVFFHPTPA